MLPEEDSSSERLCSLGSRFTLNKATNVQSNRLAKRAADGVRSGLEKVAVHGGKGWAEVIEWKQGEG